MKPNEFWNSTYREINIYTQSNLCNIIDDFKQNIRLFEAVTDKMIMADALSNKHPKILPLQKTFANLFPENKENGIQTAEQIARRMREIMKFDKK